MSYDEFVHSYSNQFCLWVEFNGHRRKLIYNDSEEVEEITVLCLKYFRETVLNNNTK